MKKTVIKRRKRVPAITSANRVSSSLTESSPGPHSVPGSAATSSIPLPREPHMSEISRPRSTQPPSARHASPDRRLPSIGSLPQISSYDMSLRPLKGASSSEKPTAWWSEDERDTSRMSRDREKNDSMDAKDKEGVSYRPLLPSFHIYLPRVLSSRPSILFYCCWNFHCSPPFLFRPACPVIPLGLPFYLLIVISPWHAILLVLYKHPLLHYPPTTYCVSLLHVKGPSSISI
jgi:hypothetical protein